MQATESPGFAEIEKFYVLINRQVNFNAGGYKTFSHFFIDRGTAVKYLNKRIKDHLAECPCCHTICDECMNAINECEDCDETYESCDDGVSIHCKSHALVMKSCDSCISIPKPNKSIYCSEYLSWSCSDTCEGECFILETIGCDMKSEDGMIATLETRS